jgi:hypothetical protein
LEAAIQTGFSHGPHFQSFEFFTRNSLFSNFTERMILSRTTFYVFWRQLETLKSLIFVWSLWLEWLCDYITNNPKQSPNVHSLHINSQFDIGRCFTKLQNYDKQALLVDSFQLSPKSLLSDQYY